MNFAVGLIVVIILLCGYLVYNNMLQDRNKLFISKTVDEFFRYLSSGNISEALDFTTGTEKYELIRNRQFYKNNVITYNIYSIDTHVLTFNDDFADVYSTFILVNTKDKSDYDVSQYKANLVKVGGLWKIMYVNYADPYLDYGALTNRNGRIASAARINISEADSTQLYDVFNHYKFYAENNDLKDSLKYLAGEAKVNQESSMDVLKSSTTSNKYVPDNTTKIVPIAKIGKELIAKVEYKFNNRNVESLVNFFNLPNGYKIIDIENVSSN